MSNYYEAIRSLPPYDHRSLAAAVRPEFPGLRHAEHPVFADGAGGSQLHESSIGAMVQQMTHGVANVGGGYATSEMVGSAVANARDAMGDFLNCGRQEERAARRVGGEGGWDGQQQGGRVGVGWVGGGVLARRVQHPYSVCPVTTSGRVRRSPSARR